MYLPKALRSLAARSVRRVFVGDDLPISEKTDFGDPGLLGPGSVSWRVLADPATITGGLAALMMQACHPLALQGVVDHSAYRQDPFGRLRRTVSYVLVTSYGSKAEAHAAAEVVTRRHSTVTGHTARGERYAASDERLMLWIHCALIQGILLAHQGFGKVALTPLEADSFVAEQATLVALLGLNAPRTASDLQDALASFHNELRRDSNTAEALEFMSSPPLPLRMKALYRVVFAGAVSVLDPEIVALLELKPPHRRSIRASRGLYRVWRAVLPTNAVLQTALTRSGE